MLARSSVRSLTKRNTISNKELTYGMVEMGGASTQIATFENDGDLMVSESNRIGSSRHKIKSTQVKVTAQQQRSHMPTNITSIHPPYKIIPSDKQTYFHSIFPFYFI